MAAKKRVMFADQVNGETVTHFHDRVIRPNEEETRAFGRDVHELGEFLRQKQPQSNPKFKISEVFKSGSFAKGTAIRGRSDIDLVVYVHGIEDVNELKNERPQLVRDIYNSIAAYEPWRGKVTELKDKRFFVNLTYGKHKVDILPACDIYKTISKEPRKIYDAMEAPWKRAVWTKSGNKRRNKIANQFSASLAKFQVDFVKAQPPQVKDAIRMLKYWKAEHEPKFKSYAMELIATYAYRQELAKGNNPNSVEVFQKSLELIADSPNMAIAFNDNYDPAEFTEFRKPPYIMDPANPYLNVFAGMKSARARRRARCHCNKFF